MSAIFEDPGLAKIFAMVLLAIIGVLALAVIILAFKKNQIIYVEKEVPVEKPSVRPLQPVEEPEDNLDDFSLTADEIIPPVVSPAETESVPIPDLPVMNSDKVVEETKAGITGISLSVTVGNNTVDTVVRDFPCLLGREASSCDIVISEPAVSRRHARFILEDGTAYIEDVSEHNGTYLNDTKLPPRGRAKIHEGDVVTLGRASIAINAFEQ